MKIPTQINKKVLLISLAFTIVTALLEWAVFAEYRQYIFENYSLFEISASAFKYYFVLIFGYVFCMFLLLIFVYLAVFSSNVLKPFYFISFTIIYLYEFTYQNLYGRFSTTQDLSLAFITTDTQSFDAIVTYTDLAALIPCIAFLLLLLLVKNDESLSLKKSFLAMGVFVVIIFAFNFLMFLAAPKFYFYESLNNSFGAGNRTFFGYVFKEAFQEETERESVEKVRRGKNPDNNIILIIDESTRGDHFSLNGYERETTPFLDKLQRENLLYNWGVSVSISTRSYESFQYILSGISTDIEGEVLKKSQQMPTLFQYAKALDYKTFYFDGQLNENWAGTPGDLQFIDVFLGKKYFDPLGDVIWDTDLKIAEKVRETVAKSKGNFIVIFKRGNHTPYNNNFPKHEAVWKPTSEKFIHNVFDSDRKTFINTYDNSIRYSVDVFFRTLLGEEAKPPIGTEILYTSDHGQTLNENGEKYSHGGDTKTQAMVPLFVISETNHRFDTNYKASHENIFPTILEMMNFPKDLRERKYAISLQKATESDSKERYFFTPNVMPGNNRIITDQRVKFD